MEAVGCYDLIDELVDRKIDSAMLREKRRSLVIQAVEDLLDDDEQANDMNAWLAMAGISAPVGTKIVAEFQEVSFTVIHCCRMLLSAVDKSEGFPWMNLKQTWGAGFLPCFCLCSMRYFGRVGRVVARFIFELF